MFLARVTTTIERSYATISSSSRKSHARWIARKDRADSSDARNVNSRGGGREPATQLSHTLVPPAGEGLRLGRRGGGRAMRACREERTKRWWNGEKRIPRRRGIIFGDVIRDSWKRRGPLIAIAAEKRRERTARGPGPPFNRTKLRVITRERALKRLRLKGIRRGGRPCVRAALARNYACMRATRTLATSADRFKATFN